MATGPDRLFRLSQQQCTGYVGNRQGEFQSAPLPSLARAPVSADDDRRQVAGKASEAARQVVAVVRQASHMKIQERLGMQSSGLLSLLHAHLAYSIYSGFIPEAPCMNLYSSLYA